MRKLFAWVFTVMLLLTAVAIPAGAEDIQSSLVDFISETNGLDREDFNIAELYELELKNLGLSLAVLTWHTEKTRGQVAWVVETGEYLADAELSDLMAQEWELWSKEYARLQKEAGKMDVWLYQQLIEAAVTEIFKIVITPNFKLTDELEEQIRDLYKEFEMEAPQDLNIWYGGQVVPGFKGMDEGSSSSGQEGSGSSGSTTPLPSGTRLPLTEPGTPGSILPLPPSGQGSDPAKPADIVDGDQPISSDYAAPDRDIYLPYNDEFYIQLNELYVQGFDHAPITAYLDSIGVDYRVKNGGIITSVTSQQALELRSLEDISWIGSYGADDYFTTLPAMAVPDIGGGESTTKGINYRTVATDSRNNVNTQPWIWSGAVLGLLAAGIFMIIKK